MKRKIKDLNSMQLIKKTILAMAACAVLFIGCSGKSGGDDGGGGAPGGASAPYESPDNTAPHVTASSPAGTGVGINSPIVVAFNEGMKESNLNNDSVKIWNGTSFITFTISHSGVVYTLTPSNPLEYGKTYTVTIKKDATDLSGNSLGGDYTFQFTTVSAPAPEINVKQQSLGNLPSGSGSYGFGNIVSGGSSSAVIFTIENLGSANLSIGSVAKSGANPEQFTIDTSGMNTSVAGGGSTTFTVSFNPAGTGNRSAVIAIANNDSDEGNYTYMVSGTGTAVPEPEINIRKGVSSITSGAQGHDFGGVIVNQSSSTVTFTIENTGPANLAISNVTINSDQFTLNTSSLDNDLSQNETTTFTATFTPTSTGNKTATVTVANNDTDEGSYTFTVVGTGNPVLTPEINITQNGMNVNSGDTVSFGGVTTNSTKSIVFVIQNLGGADLSINNTPKVAIVGTDAGAFQVNPQPISPITPGSNTTFTVLFQPTGNGERTAQLWIANNDNDEGVYCINLVGEGIEPDITIKKGAMVISSGMAYAHDFGLTAIGQTSSSAIFTIINTGTDSLNILGTPKVVSSNSAFIVNTQPTSPIEKGNFSTFTIQFKPTTSGPCTSIIQISSNDPDTPVFEFMIFGTGQLSAPSMSITAGGNYIQLDWSSVATAQSYNIYRSTDNANFSRLASNCLGNQYLDYTINSGQLYYYKMSANDANGEGAIGNSVSCFISLQAPTGLQITTSNGKPRISWNSVPGAVSYDVYIGAQIHDGSMCSEAGCFSRSGNRPFTSTRVTTTSLYYDDIAAVAGIPYRYVVRAIGSGQTEGDYSHKIGGCNITTYTKGTVITESTGLPNVSSIYKFYSCANSSTNFSVWWKSYSGNGYGYVEVYSDCSMDEGVGYSGSSNQTLYFTATPTPLYIVVVLQYPSWQWKIN